MQLLRYLQNRRYKCICFRIDERRNQVLARREKVKAKCQDRHNQLLASQAYQEFNRDADEVKPEH